MKGNWKKKILTMLRNHFALGKISFDRKFNGNVNYLVSVSNESAPLDKK